jgi:hypothetical protein
VGLAGIFGIEKEMDTDLMEGWASYSLFPPATKTHLLSPSTPFRTDDCLYWNVVFGYDLG